MNSLLHRYKGLDINFICVHIKQYCYFSSTIWQQPTSTLLYYNEHFDENNEIADDCVGCR